MKKGNPRLRALALIAPLLVFLGLFFVWPLVTVITQAVSDPAVSRVLTRTAAEIGAWDGESVPGPEIQAAFRADLAANTDEMAMGDVTRRLNSSKSGFRSLMGKTIPAVQENPDADLAGIDKRWADPAYWKAIQDNASPYTDAFLLASLDLERDSSGSVARMAEGSSANATILMRTLWISGLVTLCCLAIGLPYAMIAASVQGWKRAALLGAVLLPLWRSGSYNEEAICRALYVSAGFGQVVAARATLAGAEGGCQAEVGAASAMAAAALVELRGGTAEQCAEAFAMALTNLEGLVCDPVAGLVEIPCIKRNVIGAMNAVSCADMALAGVVGHIPADEVIDAMAEVGAAMSNDLRETGIGGLAGTPTGKAIRDIVQMQG